MTKEEIRDAVIMGGYVGSKNAERDLDEVRMKIRNLPRKAAESKILKEIDKESEFVDCYSDRWYRYKGIKEFEGLSQSLMEALTSQFFETDGLLHLSTEEIRDDVAILIRRLSLRDGLNSVYQEITSKDGRTAIAKEAHLGDKTTPIWLQSDKGLKLAERGIELGLLKDANTFNSDKWDLVCCAEMCEQLSIMLAGYGRTKWNIFAPHYFGFSRKQLIDAKSYLLNKVENGWSKAHNVIMKLKIETEYPIMK